MTIKMLTGPGSTRDIETRDLLRAFGECVRDWRRARKLHPDELAARSGYDLDDILRIEAGTREPTLAAIVALAAALGFSPHQLMTLLEGRCHRG
jgi:transcriptional regulator with XRE-family HTH domain